MLRAFYHASTERASTWLSPPRLPSGFAFSEAERMSNIITCPSGLAGRIRGMKVREERALTDRKLAKAAGRWMHCSQRAGRRRSTPGCTRSARMANSISAKCSKATDLAGATAPTHRSRYLALPSMWWAHPPATARPRSTWEGPMTRVLYNTLLFGRQMPSEGRRIPYARKSMLWTCPHACTTRRFACIRTWCPRQTCLDPAISPWPFGTNSP